MDLSSPDALGGLVGTGMWVAWAVLWLGLATTLVSALLPRPAPSPLTWRSRWAPWALALVGGGLLLQVLAGLLVGGWAWPLRPAVALVLVLALVLVAYLRRDDPRVRPARTRRASDRP